MIGVLCKHSQKRVIEEFFEIFKTPWEFYSDGHSYDVVITTLEPGSDLQARVVFVVASERRGLDDEFGLQGSALAAGAMLEYGPCAFPLHAGALKFGARSGAFLHSSGTTDAVGVEIRHGGGTIFRLGFDLFDEIERILSFGQAVEHARIPTIEIYRTMLRDLILKAGLPVLEIPPVPEGHSFAACLSHDVDFVWIRRHLIDHSLLGFYYRALVASLRDFLRGRIRLRKVLRNWSAALRTPLIFLGVLRDFWQQFDRYVQLEKARGSTFYLVPRKNHPGKSIQGPEPADSLRATRYDIGDIVPVVHDLIASGCEIGVHGIDSWHDSKAGRDELERVREITRDEEIGIRMHWLFQDGETPRVLEEAGFDYDSTVGYNEAVGYRSGTTQVYRPLGVRRLLELPMHVQDTALFYPSKMDLTEAEAEEEVSVILKNAGDYGGVVTVNWHHRSIAPERLWDDFYASLLEEFQKRKAWIGPARQIVKWFRKRRSVVFEEVTRSGEQLVVRARCTACHQVPDLRMRIHEPGGDRGERSYRDFVFSEDFHQEIAIGAPGATSKTP